MAEGKFIAYLRVSTDKQGATGHGIEAQRAAITSYLNGGHWELLQELVEVESGKNNERPQLREALGLCKLTGATLIIAKLDRLSRNMNFITSLQESGIKFIACDMPTANEFTVHIFAAMAQHERKVISQRTKDALKAAKASGVILGKNNLTTEGTAKGITASRIARQEKADNFAQSVFPIISDFHSKGMSLRMIAALLNSKNILTARGLTGAWTASAVKVVMDRLS